MRVQACIGPPPPSPVSLLPAVTSAVLVAVALGAAGVGAQPSNWERLSEAAAAGPALFDPMAQLGLATFRLGQETGLTAVTLTAYALAVAAFARAILRATGSVLWTSLAVTALGALYRERLGDPCLAVAGLVIAAGLSFLGEHDTRPRREALLGVITLFSGLIAFGAHAPPAQSPLLAWSWAEPRQLYVSNSLVTYLFLSLTAEWSVFRPQRGSLLRHLLDGTALVSCALAPASSFLLLLPLDSLLRRRGSPPAIESLDGKALSVLLSLLFPLVQAAVGLHEAPPTPLLPVSASDWLQDVAPTEPVESVPEWSGYLNLKLRATGLTRAPVNVRVVPVEEKARSGERLVFETARARVYFARPELVAAAAGHHAAHHIPFSPSNDFSAVAVIEARPDLATWLVEERLPARPEPWAATRSALQAAKFLRTHGLDLQAWGIVNSRLPSGSPAASFGHSP